MRPRLRVATTILCVATVTIPLSGCASGAPAAQATTATATAPTEVMTKEYARSYFFDAWCPAIATGKAYAQTGTSMDEVRPAAAAAMRRYDRSSDLLLHPGKQWPARDAIGAEIWGRRLADEAAYMKRISTARTLTDAADIPQPTASPASAAEVAAGKRIVKDFQLGDILYDMDPTACDGHSS